MQSHALYFVDIGGQRLAARRVRGREAMSLTFRIAVDVVLGDEQLPNPDAYVRAPVALVIARDELVFRRIDAVVTEARVSMHYQGGASAVLSLVLEPSLALLRHRRDIRVFRNKSAIDIVEEVLGGLGIEAERRLSATYAVRPYCVQMRESDFDFASRLLEDEGVAYFFDGATVVLSDSLRAHAPIEGDALSLRGDSGLDQQDEAVIAMGTRELLTAGRVSLRDFNPDHPSLNMDASAGVPGSAGPEYYDYPGEYLEPGDGAAKAARLAEAFAAASSVYLGKSFCPRLAPGFTFELDGARYLVTALMHDFDSARGGFVNAFEASDRAWRPLRVTPEPSLPNPLTATVTGPPGSDVHTDAIGRVKIHFPWDRIQPLDDNASDWVPVLQDNTGQSVGLPRVGWEVLVHFLEGDPDRPVVLGRLYNAADPFPETLPAGKTRSALRSLSSPGRDGLNAIRFEDAGGAEQVFLHAEKNHDVVVGNDKREDILALEQLIVAGAETTSIGGNDTLVVGGNRSALVAGNQTHCVAGTRTREVKGTSVANVQRNHALTIGCMHTRRIGSQDSVATTALGEQVGAMILETSAADNALTSGMAATFTVGGALIEAAAKSKSEETKLARAEMVGGVLVSKTAKVTSIEAKARSTTVGGLYRVSAAKKVSFEAGVAMQITSTMARFEHAKSITLKVGDCTVVMKDGVLAINAPKKIIMKASGENLQAAGESSQN
ncbi:MAG TPA: type VI secretion system tip protein TssI/VgrG [Polyangiaceae bacterium]|nr:type VI secretion system tip protein TssI/VgrG [Polyangiaceae bacterium]